MRTRILLTAATLLVSPLALAQTPPEAPSAPAAPAAPQPPQIEMMPLPDLRTPSRESAEARRDAAEARREAQEARRAAREAAREAERDVDDHLRGLGDRIRERVNHAIMAQAGRPVPPLPPIPDLGAISTTRLNDVDKQLSIDDARRIVDGAIAFRGNKRLKVGKAEADGDEWARVEVRTVDDSLVDTVRVNRKTGLLERAP
jgi:hypothetical protein